MASLRASTPKPRRQYVAALVVAVVTLLLIGGAYVSQRLTDDEPPTASAASEIAVRDDSHRLQEATDPDAPVFVEFLDFECESCAAAYPYVERLRSTYKGKVTFVVRYFPIPSHRNAQNAAYAVEAAARQGALEPMYRRMFDTQATWGEQQESRAGLFREYAEDLGLDMEQYDADVASESVAQRVQADVDDGTRLGVSGTPTFFLDGEQLAIREPGDFDAAIEDALAR